MWKESFANDIAQCCYDCYEKISKSGKPKRGEEWTLLAAVVMVTKQGSDVISKVVAMGTGSKCIGQDKLSKKGDIVHDSHAEVLARRAFLCYLYGQINSILDGNESECLDVESGKTFKCSVKDAVSFHFFTSHTPCGDASIFPKHLDHKDSENGSEEYGDIVYKENDSCINEKSVSPHIGENCRKRPQKETYTEEHTKGDKRAKFESEKCIGKNIMNAKTEPCNSVENGDGELTDMSSKICKFDNQGNIKNTVKIQTEELGAKLNGNIKSLEEVVHENGVESSKGGKQDLHRTEVKFAEGGECNTHRTKENCVEDDAHYTQKMRAKCETFDEQKIHELGIKCEKGGKQDIHRTGAKCVEGGIQDSHGTGAQYHTVGAFRIKPGRGVRTLSLSCSDKLAKWNVCGCQGALLCKFLTTPVYFSSVIVGKCPYYKNALYRALVTRNSGCQGLHTPFHLNEPELLQSKLMFPDSREAVQHRYEEERDYRPSPASIIWYADDKVNTGVCDVIVNGKKQGITKKNYHSPKSRSTVCKIELFHRYMGIIEKLLDQNRCSEDLRDLDLQCTYREAKMHSSDYQQTWKKLVAHYGVWSHKPQEILDFVADCS